MSGSTPQLGDELIQAVRNGDRALVSRLLEAGADVNHLNYNGFSALMLAARGEAELVSLLVASGAAVNQIGVSLFGNSYPTPLREAIDRKQSDIVRILVQHGADVNEMHPGWYSPLHMAAWSGYGYEERDSEIVSVLIESGANVNLLSSIQLLFSPLYAAARKANAPIVAKLIRAGADVNLLVNNRGQTALMGAALRPPAGKDFTRIYRRQMETISLLIQAGANINAVSDDGETALLNAVEEGGEDPLRLLIANGANVNQRTALGSPLMKAIEIRNSNKVRLLVLGGAETGNLSEYAVQVFIRPIIGAHDELMMHQISLIKTAYVKLKESKQKEKMFKNAAFRDSLGEWNDLRMDMVSRIISFLVTLETEDQLVTYILAPFLANADMEHLNRFGLVLSFLTAPCGGKETALLEISKCSAEPEQIRFNQATFRYAILMGSFKPSSDSFLDPMYAVYSNLIADFGATQKGLRRIVEVNIGTVYQFRHGEFGIYSKFAKYLHEMLI